MNEIIIKFENISKQYHLGTIGTGTLSHDLNRWWTMNIRRKEDPYLMIGQINDRATRANGEYIWALRNINLEINQGEVLGIIGKNGAGKSTLLKILSRVTVPTTGRILALGRIASLLEVGTGFHSEMTGRENIYMNGSIMGMTKAEITRKMDEIVDFAGVEKYIDTPVKRYSSGMTVRLGFAIAAHLEPEILVVDEVLAVGDAEFQKKAIGKMQEVSHGNGRTVLFVSHNMSAVATLCSKTLLIENGTNKMIGQTKEVIDYYIEESIKLTSSWQSTIKHNEVASFISARICDENNKECIVISNEKVFFLVICVEVSGLNFNGTFGFEIKNSSGVSIFTSHDHDSQEISYKTGIYEFRIKIPDFLRSGNYYVNIGSNSIGFNSIEYFEKVLQFEITESDQKMSFDRPGTILPKLKWNISRIL